MIMSGLTLALIQTSMAVAVGFYITRVFRRCVSHVLDYANFEDDPNDPDSYWPSDAAGGDSDGS